MSEIYESEELEKYIRLAPGDTRMSGVLASEIISLRSQLAAMTKERNQFCSDMSHTWTPPVCRDCGKHCDPGALRMVNLESENAVMRAEVEHLTATAMGAEARSERDRVRAEKAEAEVGRLKELAQGPNTNWAKVEDARNRMEAAERCSGTWMKDRDTAIQQRIIAEAALRDAQEKFANLEAMEWEGQAVTTQVKLNEALAQAKTYREALRLNLESNVSNLYVLGTVKDGLKQYVQGPDWDLVIASIQEEHDLAQDALANASPYNIEKEVAELQAMIDAPDPSPPAPTEPAPKKDEEAGSGFDPWKEYDGNGRPLNP